MTTTFSDRIIFYTVVKTKFGQALRFYRIIIFMTHYHVKLET